MNRRKCPICGRLLVEPAGHPSARVLLVGEYPGVEEIKLGTPFVGPTGDILKEELGRVGIQMGLCRVTNLWMHAPDEKCDVNWHMMELAKELKGRPFVLAMGSDVSEILFHDSVMSLSGMKKKHELFPGSLFVISPNPASLLHKGATVGELRLAFQRFAVVQKER